MWEDVHDLRMEPRQDLTTFQSVQNDLFSVLLWKQSLIDANRLPWYRLS